MSARRFQLAGALLVLTVILIAGCSDGSGTIPIRGQVLYNGAPLPEGTVVYLPRDHTTSRQATGAIQPDGSFELMTQAKGDGVLPGQYAIVIYAYQPHPGEPKSREEHEAMVKAGGIQRGYLIPERYTDPARSGLSDTVDENHSRFKRIELSD